MGARLGASVDGRPIGLVVTPPRTEHLLRRGGVELSPATPANPALSGESVRPPAFQTDRAAKSPGLSPAARLKDFTALAACDIARRQSIPSPFAIGQHDGALLGRLGLTCGVLAPVLAARQDLQIVWVIVLRVSVAVMHVVPSRDRATGLLVHLAVEIPARSPVRVVAVGPLPPRDARKPHADHSSSPPCKAPAATQPRDVSIG